MNIEEIHDYCMAKKGVTASFPFDGDTLVFKVAGKMFLFIALEKNSANVKCDPARAIELREQYPFVIPGYHMNKMMWNTIETIDDVAPSLLTGWIDDSYALVAAKLTKKERDRYGFA
ncbi:MAG: MmcQ/YjbR family DNA-binding protein [Prevotellaceae bacterium]|jgi:predicted DNA-binding protein (MmcQ/YjbR family)|nr:MmcQ/YjbR family DNA-binding protein [Prevotellaceae bacterium]